MYPLESLKALGYEGFVDWKTLRSSGYKRIPITRGTYIVLLPDNFQPRFLPRSVGAIIKEKIPTVPINMLRSNWVEDTAIVYVGKATNLRSRISMFSRFGQGEPAYHQGGRYIWQIDRSEDLLVCWRDSRGVDPRLVEKQLISQFKQKHNGRRPFANLTD